MKKISEALDIFIQKNDFFLFGLSQDLINVKQLARFIQSDIEAMTGKEVTLLSLAKSIREYQKTLFHKNIRQYTPSIKNLSIHSELVTISFARHPDLYAQIHKAHEKSITKEVFFIFSESITQITVVFDAHFLPTFQSIVKHEPLYTNQNIASLHLMFSPDDFDHPGLLGLFTQKLSFHKINIIEIFSTYTEFVLCLDRDDMQMAFDVLYQAFMEKKRIELH